MIDAGVDAACNGRGETGPPCVRRESTIDNRRSGFVSGPSLLCRVLGGALAITGGCTGISIAPSCPNELQVNESAPLLANEINPGAVAQYSWTVDPPNIGRVLNPTAPSTMFQARAEGQARVQLTASDGLYQVVSYCVVRVSGVAEPPDDNTNENANDNTADNTNVNDNRDNTNDNADRPGGVRKRKEGDGSHG